MSKYCGQLRVGLVLFGVLALIATVALTAITMRPTEATWSDRVMGTSQFGTSPLTGQSYARSLASYGTMNRWISGNELRGPSRAEAQAATAPQRAESTKQTESSPASLLGGGVLPVTTEARTCARASELADDCAPESTYPTPRPANYAVAELHSLGVHALRVLWIPTTQLVTYNASSPIRTTASCSPGAKGVASMSSGGMINLGGRLLDDKASIAVPTEPGASRPVTREWGAYNYRAMVFHDRVQELNHAVSQVRLVVEATAWNADGERWALNLILARAECGVAMPMPPMVPRPSADNLQFPAAAPAPRRTVLDQPEIATAQEITPEADQPAHDGAAVEPSLPSLEDAADDEASTGEARNATESAPSQTDAPQPTQSLELHAAEPETDSEPADSTPATSKPATSEPTEPTTVLAGPQDPEPVRVGRKFAVVNREGVELGSARIDDIVRTPGCGVELTLSIRASDEAGRDRWASIGPDDFAEVRPGGSIRKAGRVSSDCGQAANSRVTALSAGREYEIVIAIALDDSAQQAMLRPDGTAGWMFDLPPLPKVTATTSPSASPPTSSPATAPGEPSVETSVNTAAA